MAKTNSGSGGSGIPLNQKGAANGVATLDINSQLVQVAPPVDLNIGFSGGEIANTQFVSDFIDASSTGYNLYLSGDYPVGTGETITFGDLVAVSYDPVPNKPAKVFLAQAGTGDFRERLSGIIASEPEAGQFTVLHEGPITQPLSQWDVAPAVTDIGKWVYLSTTKNKLSLTQVGSAIRAGQLMFVGGSQTEIYLDIK